MTGVRPVMADHETLSTTLHELDYVAGCANRRWVRESAAGLHRWRDSFLLSGMTVDATTTWRFTPSTTHVPPSSCARSMGGSSGLNITVIVDLPTAPAECFLLFHGGRVLSTPNASATPNGVWITQPTNNVTLACPGQSPQRWPLRDVPALKSDDDLEPATANSEGSVAQPVVVNSSRRSNPTLWVFGNNLVAMDRGAPRTQIHVFWSSSPQLSSWSHRMLIQLPSEQSATIDESASRADNPPHVKPGTLPYWTGANTSPTKGVFPNGTVAYFLVLEIGNPSTVVQHKGGFIAVFAACIQCATEGDLSLASEWHILNPHTHVYRQDRTSECPTLRFFDGWFYVLVNWLNVSGAHAPAGTHCHSNSKHWSGCLAVHIARSRDLSVWEEPRVSDVPLGLPDGNNTHGPDHHILRGSLLDQIHDETLKLYVQNQTDDVDRSDMDMVTLPDGTTYVVYWSGNQAKATAPNLAMDNQGAGLINGTEQEWLEGFFR
eukprot:SAG11_NODE_162_length_13962_cov_19.035562_3_plen_490_part_00